jgi:hypothetical protein
LVRNQLLKINSEEQNDVDKLAKELERGHEQ